MLSRIRLESRIRFLGDPVEIARRAWFRDHGDQTLRINYPLTAESVVFDVGGYFGDWSSEISRRHDPRIFIFEPVPEHYSRIVERFRRNRKVKVFDYGLSSQNSTTRIFLANDGSSAYRQAKTSVQARFRDICEVVRENHLARIDLIKINIEGGEFELLDRMIQTDLVAICNDIQVQFHDFYPDAPSLRLRIRAQLARTHALTYEYCFVWENWHRTDAPNTHADR